MLKSDQSQDMFTQCAGVRHYGNDVWRPTIKFRVSHLLDRFNIQTRETGSVIARKQVIRSMS
jgi:hypothetical protein